MKKIISLFQRNYDGDRLVRDEVVPGAEWVLAGEGIATRKFDGSCCMVRSGKLFKRYDAKNGKVPPVGFEPAQDAAPVTGHLPGWLPVGEGPEDRWFRVALVSWPDAPDGTYEACGPHFQSNPEGFASDQLIPHGLPQASWVNDAPRTFVQLKAYLATKGIEGIVWHHPDGRMVKIKTKDFHGKKRGATTGVEPAEGGK
jgi:hypothetical protein